MAVLLLLPPCLEHTFSPARIWLQVALTLADLEAWKASSQAVVAKTMASLHARIVACMAKLSQQLAAELATRQAAAVEEKQVRRRVDRLLSRTALLLLADREMHSVVLTPLPKGMAWTLMPQHEISAQQTVACCLPVRG